VIVLTNEGAEGIHGNRVERIDTSSIQEETEHLAGNPALPTRKGRLKDSQKTAPLGSWELDVEESAFRASDGFFRILEWPPATAALPFGKVMDAIPVADRDRVTEALEWALETREPFDLEHRVVRPDGTMRVVRSRGQVVMNIGGGPVRLVGTTCDITEAKRTHEELRESEEKYLALVASLPDVLWTSDATGNPVFVSPNCERV
jgi:PAS domain-containing protein